MSDDRWKTTAGWAAEKLDGLPKTRKGVEWVAERDGWRCLGGHLARERKAIGGGWEYHLNILPPEAQDHYRRKQALAEREAERDASAHQLAAQAAVGLAEEVLPSKVEVVDARRARIRSARYMVLKEIEVWEYLHGGIDKAIIRFVSEFNAKILPQHLIETVECALEKSRGSLSRRTIYNWRSALKKHGTAGLVPKLPLQQTKANVEEIYPWLPQFLRFYGKPSKPSIRICIEKTIAALSPEGMAELKAAGHAPDYDKARRALKALQQNGEHLKTLKGRFGPLALKQRMLFKRRTLEGIDPGTIYSADGKTFDAEVAHPIHGQPFRPEITTVVDIATRKIVGWSIDLAENQRTVSDALRVASERHGIAAIFYADRGPGYNNEAIDALCDRLGTTVMHSLPYNSQSRGVVERLNGSVWNTLAKEFPTYIGPDMDREAKMRVHKQTRRELKAAGVSPLLPDFAWFVERVEAMVAWYNDRPHSSLKVIDAETGRKRDASPNEKWAEFEAAGFEAVTIEADEVDDLFRPYVRRACRRGIVQWMGNEYSGNLLDCWHGREVFVGYDVHDAERVWVREIIEVEGRDIPGMLICVAEFWHNKERYVPVSTQRAAEEKRAKGRLRRLEDKQRVIEGELRAPLLEAQVEIPIDIRLPEAEPAEPVPNADVFFMGPAPATAPRRRFKDDQELAEHCIAHPEDMTVNQRRLLVQLYNSPSGRELYELRGGNSVALKRLLDATVQKSTDQKSSTEDQPK